MTFRWRPERRWSVRLGCGSRSFVARVSMIEPKTNPGSEEHESIERYDLEVAPRVRNLPPYLFGRINELKYRKRRAGIDVIDLGMGNPDRPARGVGHRQALRGRPRLAEPPLQRRHRHLQPAPRGRRSGTSRGSASRLDPDHEVVATLGSKEGFSHMCLALLGPGDTAIVPAPSFPIHIHAVALASANVISLDVRDAATLPGEHRLDLREPVSRGRRS